MATPPDFTTGQVLTAAQMDAVGLWLVKTQTVGTAVTSVTVNNAFNADYENYVVTYSDGVKSLDTEFRLELGSATSGYYGNIVYGHYNDTTPRSVNDNNASRFSYVGGGDTLGLAAYIVLLNPYLARPTYVQATASASLFNGTYTGRQNTSTSFTSFILSTPTGTMTGGTIRVYGYRK